MCLKEKNWKQYHRIKNQKVHLKTFIKKCLSHNDFQIVLKNNRGLKDCHKGERCFVLGNGPSLKNDDLRKLENEFVFSVNQIARHPDFEHIKPTYHFWADPHFFEINDSNPEDLELLEIMKNVNTNENSPLCFFPIQQKSFVEKYKLDSILKINYFYSGLNFYDGFDESIDYTKAVPGFGTVVQWCITMAIYMGFSEIYLLGCDNTSLVTTIKSALKSNNDSDYVYNITENEKKRMESLLERTPLEAYIREYLNTFVGYRNLFYYCEKRSIKLVNCSSTTVIDSIPRDTLINVLKNNKR